MNIKCGLCGREIVVEDDLVDGQHVCCPYCGGKSEYRKPSRIELPTGFENRRRGADQLPPRDAAAPEVMPETPPEEQKVRKPLRVIRKNEGTSAGSESVERQMAERRVNMAERHARFYEEMQDNAHRRKLREKLTRVLLLVVLALCAAGIYWFIEFRKEQFRRADIQLADERNRLEAERAEQERDEKAFRVAQEATEREKRLADEKARQEEIRRVQAERGKRDNELLETKVLYRKACALFRDGEFGFMRSLPMNSQPGKTAGEFYYLLPFLDNQEIIVCQSTTNGIASVFRLDGTGKRTAVEVEAFLSSLQGKDYLLAHGENVYFQSKRRKPHVGQISKTEVADLVEEFFGDISPEAKKLDLDPDGVSFEIVFVPGGSKKPIIADTIEYGATYSLSKVREAVENAFPMKTSSLSKSTGGKKKFKRTVVFWDGAHIKKGVGDVTYVPRVPPPVSYGTRVYGYGWYYNSSSWHNEAKRRRRAEYTRAQWQALVDEANKQDREEKLFYERQAASLKEAAQSALSQAERDYAAKIDRIYNSGTLYFRAKIAK